MLPFHLIDTLVLQIEMTPLTSLDTFNSLLETVHLLKSAANAAHLARSIEQYRAGQLRQQDLVDAG